MIETEGKRYTVTSQLRIKPGAADDYMGYTCQAKHKALHPERPLQTTVQLSVLCKYPSISNALRPSDMRVLPT